MALPGLGGGRLADAGGRGSWPAVGSRLHHSVGIWPMLIDDNTEVVAAVELKSLSLRARGWPIGEARVDILLEPVGAETQVTISEDAVSGPGPWRPRRCAASPSSGATPRPCAASPTSPSGARDPRSAAAAGRPDHRGFERDRRGDRPARRRPRGPPRAARPCRRVPRAGRVRLRRPRRGLDAGDRRRRERRRAGRGGRGRHHDAARQDRPGHRAAPAWSPTGASRTSPSTSSTR